VAGVALVLAPVALRNALVGGDPLPTTFQGGTNFYIGNNALADGTYRPIVPGKQVPELERREPVRLAEQRLGRRLSPAEVSRYWLGQGLAWAGAHPGDFVRLLLRKVGLFWSWYEWPDAVDYYQVRAESPVFRLPLLEFGGVTLLAALGLAWLPRRGLAWRVAPLSSTGVPKVVVLKADEPEADELDVDEPEVDEPERIGLARRFAPPLVFAAGWMASTVVFFLFARYRLPVVPALLLLAALPVAALLPRVEVAGTVPEAAADPAAKGSDAALGPNATTGPEMARFPEEVARGPEVARGKEAARGSAVATGLAATGAGAARRRVVTLALALAVAAALALPRLAGFAPRLDLVRFNLARLAEERGDLEEARRDYEGTLAVSPDDFLAWLDLGNLAARRRDWPEALRCYRRAAELEPASDDAQSNLGGVHLALGSPAAAAHLARALELNPRSVQALHNSALLQLRLGDLGAARQLNERTLAVDPANAAARRLQARLAGLAAAAGAAPAVPTAPAPAAEKR
jgi:tetratricopeptide (TPR) repeat protein